jgi:hypothetical protein
MGVLRRLRLKSIWRPRRVRRARAVPDGWPNAAVGLRPGINEVAASVPIAVPEPSDSVRYPLDFDIGEVADGYHLIARGVSLRGANLTFEWAVVPEPTEEAEVWPEMNYGADVSPRGWNSWRSDCDGFERPVPKARHVWFDFFRTDYDWIVPFYRDGQPDSDYLRNRIARLTLDLKTGEAQIER